MENIDMFKSNHERRMRYSIRKFSVGVASVAVASLFMGSVVHATEKEGSTQAATSFNRLFVNCSGLKKS